MGQLSVDRRLFIALHRETLGESESRFGVFTKVEFSFRIALYVSPAQARKKDRFCLVSQAACVFSGSYESGVEI